MRKKIIAGNWKMNKTPSEAKSLVEAIAAKVADAKCDVVVCPTAICIPSAVDAAHKTFTLKKAALTQANSRQICSPKQA